MYAPFDQVEEEVLFLLFKPYSAGDNIAVAEAVKLLVQVMVSGDNTNCSGQKSISEKRWWNSERSFSH